VAGLWLAGVALAGFTATRAWSRVGPTRALPYLAVVAGGIVLAAAVLRRNGVALAISTIGLGGQILGVIGSAWELAVGVHDFKARELRDLGFDPEFGVALNLLYSAVASAVFAWAVARWLAGRR
jgi:ABC-type branched-subunit amino acid transport system permease subunit